MQLGFRRLVPFLLGISVLGILVIGAGAAGPSEKDAGLPVKRVVMFASDGMFWNTSSWPKRRYGSPW